MISTLLSFTQIVLALLAISPDHLFHSDSLIDRGGGDGKNSGAMPLIFSPVHVTARLHKNMHTRSDTLSELALVPQILTCRRLARLHERLKHKSFHERVAPIRKLLTTGMALSYLVSDTCINLSSEVHWQCESDVASCSSCSIMHLI